MVNSFDDYRPDINGISILPLMNTSISFRVNIQVLCSMSKEKIKVK